MKVTDQNNPISSAIFLLETAASIILRNPDCNCIIPILYIPHINMDYSTMDCWNFYSGKLLKVVLMFP